MNFAFPQEKVSAIEAAILGIPIPTRQSCVISQPGWHQIITPGVKLRVMNSVLRCEIEEWNAEARVEATIDQYRKNGAPFGWLVSPGTKPMDLGDLLLKKGMSLDYEALGMVRSTADFLAPEIPGLTIELATPSNVEDFLQAATEGRYAAETSSRKEALKRYVLIEQDPLTLQNFLARLDGKPAATATLRIVREGKSYFGSLNGAMVLPEFRKRGIYSALVAHRMQLLEAMGIQLGVVLAHRETSAPICRKMKFETVSKLQMYKG